MQDGKIIQTNNGTIIVPYQKNSLRDLIRSTSSFDKVYHKRNEVTGFQIEYKGEPAFLTHNLNSNYIQNMVPTYQLEKMKMNHITRTLEDFELNHDITPTEVQYSIIDDIMKDINANNSKPYEWFVNLQTGYGKTLLSVYLASVIKYKTLIMCFSTDILKQWIKTIKEMSTFNSKRLLLINDSQILKSIYEKTFPVENFDIYMCTPKLLTSYGNKHGYDKLYEIFDTIGIGLKIFDEAHRNKANLVKINALTNVKYSIYLSADYAQGDSREEKMYFAIFNNCKIIRPDEKYVKDMRYTKAIVVEFNTNPDLLHVESIFNRYGFSSQYYINYEFENGLIIKVINYIIDYINKINDNGHKILILMTYIKHVDLMYDILTKRYSDQHNIGRFHSQVPEEEKEFTKTNSDIIVSTYSSFGTGIDVHDIKYVISLNQCNKIEDNQAAGRARPLKDGTDAVYFMLVDYGFPYCKKKLKIRLSYLQSTKIKEVFHLKYQI